MDPSVRMGPMCVKKKEPLGTLVVVVQGPAMSKGCGLGGMGWRGNSGPLGGVYAGFGTTW
jgi:hypothetical protein